MIIRGALIALTALAVAAPALAGQPVVLKSRPAASSGAVTLGDLFEGASGPAAKVVVAPAPAPGINAVLDAGRVLLAAKAAGLDWDNAQGVRRVIVASSGGASAASPATAARPGRSAQALVYARNLAAGEILGASDLIWSSDAIAPSNAPGDPDKVIGMAARRPLREGAAVMSSDVSSPIAVKKDEMITVAFQAGGIALTLQAKALMDAAVGEPVQVMNLQSKKIIEAVVASPGRALVGPAAEALKSRAFITASLR